MRLPGQVFIPGSVPQISCQSWTIILSERVENEVMKAILLILCLLCLACISLSGQQGQWAAYTNNEDVRCFAENNQYYWIGTSNGMVRHDKINGTLAHYNLANSLLGEPDINCLEMSSEGILWIGTEMGLFKCTNGTFERISFEGYGLDRWNILCICEARDSTIWFGGEHWLGKIDEDNLSFYRSPIIPSGHISFIQRGSANSIWFASNHYYSSEESSYSLVNIVKYAEGIFTPFQIYSGSGYRKIDSMVACGQDSLWFYYNYSPQFRKFVNGTITETITVNDFGVTLTGFPHLAVDEFGSLWISFTSTLIKWQSGQITVYQNPSPGVSSIMINAIQFDTLGNLLIGTAGKGFSTFDGDIFQQHLISNSPLSNKLLNDINVSPDDIMWVSEGNRLLGLDGNEWITIPYPFNDSSTYGFRCFGFSSTGILWVFTGFRLASYDGTNWTSYILSDYGITGFSGDKLICDNSGNVWVGVRRDGYAGGLLKYDGQNLIHYTNQNSILNSSLITAIGVDNIGRLLVATGLHSLYRITGSTFELLITIPPSESSIKDLSVSSDGQIWAVWYYGRLESFNGSYWVAHTLSDDSNDDPLHIEFDSMDCLWMITRLNKICSYYNGSATWYESPGIGYNYSYNSNFHLLSNGNIWIDPKIKGCLLLLDFNGVINDDLTAIPVADPNLRIFPNPFRESAHISFSVADKGKTTLSIYNLRGQKVRTLIDGSLPDGKHSITWDGKDMNGRGTSSGIYILRLEQGGVSAVKKLVLMR
jgi:ligand-binding sensor domain-containing protein